MPLTSYFVFPGQAEDVLEFYRDALGGSVEIQRYAGSPAEGMMPPGWGNKVLHGLLVSPVGTIGVMDSSPDRAGNAGDGNFMVSIALTDLSSAPVIFGKLSAGGEVTMPLEKTFWSPLFGMCTDKYGTKWMVDCS
jgi:PhnB protein